MSPTHDFSDLRFVGLEELPADKLYNVNPAGNFSCKYCAVPKYNRYFKQPDILIERKLLHFV